MMRGAVVLRPVPGDARTAARLAAAGVRVRRCPLFAVAPVAWSPPDATRYDALLLTSANAVRHAGAELAALRTLPVLAVGGATASAAQAAGLTVAMTGDRDAADLAAAARAVGWARLLHLAGRDRGRLRNVDQITVYASDAVPIDPGAARAWADHVALLHSARAAERFAALVTRDAVARSRIAVAAISEAVATATGDGWATRIVAGVPTDAALVTAACALIDRAGTAADKHPA